MKHNPVCEYENRFACDVGVPYAYAFWKGRVALYAILRALGIGKGDEVILPGFTCVVVPNSIISTGAKPIYADIEPGTYNLDPGSVEKAVTSHSRALIIQHTFGSPAKMDLLMAVAERHGLTVIEDCAHALGSTYRGRPLGTFGIASFYSSQWSKTYTTGLGGIAATSNPSLARSLARLQSEFFRPSRMHIARLRIQHSIHKKLLSPRLYWLAMDAFHLLSRWNLFVGSSSAQELDGKVANDGSWSMSEFQARIGLDCLKKLPSNLSHRRLLAGLYWKELNGNGWGHVPNPDEDGAFLLRYPVRVANKQEMLEKAARARIELGSWFESPVHPVCSGLERFAYVKGACPVAECACSEVINLPLHSKTSRLEAYKTLAYILRTAKKSVNGSSLSTKAY
jgi:perosamine synthetase